LSANHDGDDVIDPYDIFNVEEEHSLYTPNAYNYQTISVDNVNDFTLHIRATNDIHVGLYTNGSEMYEVVIGGWGN
jgi:hypothetical protein